MTLKEGDKSDMTITHASTRERFMPGLVFPYKTLFDKRLETE